jgi:hypothetical protein
MLAVYNKMKASERKKAARVGSEGKHNYRQSYDA